MNNGIEWVAKVVFGVYVAALLFMFCYGLIQVHLVIKYLKHRKKAKLKLVPPLRIGNFPYVTVQLPVYNESLVIERLIDAVANFNYPRDKFEIQVLDDSTDDTTAIIADKVYHYKARGLNIFHIRRSNRVGFKAGALQEGLRLAKGEFIALFDADFVPNKNFLIDTLPAFTNEQIGMVQTRWAHLNQNHSLLTQFQAFLLDSHFSIEQTGRNSAGYFINFSGTGGVWRKACMLDAGGWHTDTLTEDFDLSYRAQLKGWKFKYLQDICVPAELPPVMSALKTQQYRWIKGNAETARKHLGNVLRAKLPLATKVNACFHLIVSAIFICVLISSFLSLPLLYLKTQVPELSSWLRYASFSFISLICLGTFHYVATVYTNFTKNSNKHYFFKTFPLYLTYSMGIALNNAIAAIEGLLGIKSTFVRTPKFNVSGNSSVINSVHMRQKNRHPLLVFEMLFVAYYLIGGIALAFYCKDFSMLPYHLMLAFGFGLICYYSLVEQRMYKTVIRSNSVLVTANAA
jgi:cellulose synthase/poly-beta-1,6-N-acetylglucosamine synthase-like glycosyltransferase